MKRILSLVAAALAASTFWTVPAFAMPQAIPFIALGFTVSVGTGIAAIGSVIAAYASILLPIGLTLASSLFAPKPPKPEDVQINLRQSTPFRGALYGRGLIGGPWVFGGTKRGDFHKVIALSSRKLSGINNFWVDDAIVTRGSDGWVTSEQHTYKGAKFLRLLYRMGNATETHYSELATAYPGEWTSAHRGDGVATLYAYQSKMKAENIPRIFPNLINTLYRVDANGAAVFDPTNVGHDIGNPATWSYSDNMARIAMDYLWHRDGMRIPAEMLTTPQALAGWQQAVIEAGEAVSLKAGGSEPRYRCWTYYQYNERPADVLSRILAGADAKLVPTRDGGLTMQVGKWREPTVTIDETCIVGFEGVSRGKDIMQTANVTRATFQSPDHEFQTTDADPWIDEDDVSARGEIEGPELSLTTVPSHGQCRRLMKIKAHQSAPEWIGNFILNLEGLAVMGERFINLSYPAFGIEGSFEVLDFKLVVGENGTLSGAQISVQSMTSAAYAWDAASEEGTPPPFNETIEERSTTDPVAGSFLATLRSKFSGSGYRAYAYLEWPAPDGGTGLDIVINSRVYGRRVGDAEWIELYSGPDTTLEWEMVEEGQEYEFELTYFSFFSGEGERVQSSPPTLTAISNPTPPAPVSSVVAVGGSGQVDISWMGPNDPAYIGAAIRRNTTNNESTATLVRIEYGAPSASDAWSDTGLTPGTYYYWLKSRNASSVESMSVATGPVTVT